MVADKGYAAHSFREAIRDMGSRPAIPTKSNEPPVRCPAWIYNNRRQIKNAWARLKEWRAVANPLREDRRVLLGRSLLRSGRAMDQALTGIPFKVPALPLP